MAALLLPYNISSTIYFPLIGSGTAAFSTAGSGSLVGTNVQISKDGSAFGTSTNTGTHVGIGIYRLVLSTSELSAKQVMVVIAGSGGSLGTVVEAQAVFIHTFGNASAMYPYDLGTALSAQTVGTVTTITNAVSITGTPAVDVVTWKGTLAAGTGGKPNVGTADFAATGTITTITNAVSVTGTPAVDVVTWKGTAAAGTTGKPNIGTADFVTGTINADIKLIDGTVGAAQQLAKSVSVIIDGTATGTLTTTAFDTNLTAADNDHYNGRIIIFIAGSLAYQATDIKDYAGSSVGTLAQVTVTSLTRAPTAGDKFIVV